MSKINLKRTVNFNYILTHCDQPDKKCINKFYFNRQPLIKIANMMYEWYASLWMKIKIFIMSLKNSKYFQSLKIYSKSLVLFLFIKNRFFFHTVHPDHRFYAPPRLIKTSPHLPLSLGPLCYVSFSEKRRVPRHNNQKIKINSKKLKKKNRTR